MNTNWSTPKRNFLAGLNDLRKALASGMNARLIRARNEDCRHPLKVRNETKDFRNYEFMNGHAACKDSINANAAMSDFEKHLATNYVNCYGTPEAVDRYYETGILQPNNDNGIGTSHLVLVVDLVEMLHGEGQHERANMFTRQYLTPGYDSIVHLYSFYRLKRDQTQWNLRTFKRKLWVVELLGDEPKPKVPVLVHVLNVLAYPLKFVPKRRVLRMDDYRCVTYSIGSVVNGFSVEFTIPKRFSFSNDID
jgi:hypothetical protein